MTARAIAAAQTVPVAGDVDANVAEHLRLVALAAREDAEVVVFPELSLTGYELDRAAELAFAEDDARLGPLRDAAAAARATLVVGAPVRVGARLHVGAFVLAPDAAPALYTKRHLGAFGPDANPGGAVPPAEASVFAPGDRDPPVRLEGRDAALAVCADAARPAHARAAAERGARCYLASSFVIPAELERDAARLAGYAARHGMAVALANFGGPSGGLPSAGCSAVWSDAGALVARLPAAGAGLALARAGAAGWTGAARPLARPAGGAR